jgi:hypothetical protein
MDRRTLPLDGLKVDFIIESSSGGGVETASRRIVIGLTSGAVAVAADKCSTGEIPRRLLAMALVGGCCLTGVTSIFISIPNFQS